MIFSLAFRLPVISYKDWMELLEKSVVDLAKCSSAEDTKRLLGRIPALQVLDFFRTAASRFGVDRLANC